MDRLLHFLLLILSTISPVQPGGIDLVGIVGIVDIVAIVDREDLVQQVGSVAHDRGATPAQRPTPRARSKAEISASASNSSSGDKFRVKPKGLSFRPGAKRSLVRVRALPLVTQDGTRIDLAREPGWKVISFWSPGCPCVQSCQTYSLIPLWKQLGKYREKENRNNHRNGIINDLSNDVGQNADRNSVHFYAVASNAATLEYPQGALSPVRLYLPGSPEQRPPYPLLLDSHHEVANALGAVSTPETSLISPSGLVVFRGDPDNSAQIRKELGLEKATRFYLRDALTRALSNKPVRFPVAPVFGCTIDRSDEE